MNKNTTKIPLCETKWSLALNIFQRNHCFGLYKNCFKVISDMNIIWFQYKILFHILDTKGNLYKIKISDSNLCSFCKEHHETIVHMFCESTKVVDLWDNIKSWIYNKIQYIIDITSVMKIMGYPNLDDIFWPINLILTSKLYYIYKCSKNNRPMNIFYLQKEIKQRFFWTKIFIQYKSKSSRNIYEKNWRMNKYFYKYIVKIKPQQMQSRVIYISIYTLLFIITIVYQWATFVASFLNIDFC